MTNLMIRIVTLATCSMALIAAFSFTPVVAAGGGGGGGDGGATYGGTDQRSAYPPSYYPKRSGAKATHVPKAKKANQSLFDDGCGRGRPVSKIAREHTQGGIGEEVQIICEALVGHPFPNRRDYVVSNPHKRTAFEVLSQTSRLRRPRVQARSGLRAA